MNSAAAADERRGPGRPRVPVDRIVQNALALVAEEGAAALSMRSLAKRLGTGTAVLYRAISGRAELIELMVDSALGDLVRETSTERENTWQESCRVAAFALFDALASHRGLAALVIERVPVGPNTLIVRERMLSHLLHEGFTPESAARVYATIARFAVGFAAQLPDESRRAGGPRPEADGGGSLRVQFRGLPSGRFPAIRAVADSLPAQRVEDEFRYGLEMLLSGIAREFEAHARRS